MNSEHRRDGAPRLAALMWPMTPVSAIILTHNEERNIRECIRSLHWAAEVIVVDSGSTDATTTAARQAREDVCVFHHPFLDFGDQRNWALDEAAPAHDWILFLDADERCTPELAASIQRVVAAPTGAVGYFLCYRNYFLGRWIRRCTRFPTWQLRLIKRGQVRYEKMGHGQKEVTSGPLAYLQEPYDHYGFSQGVAHWIARHNKYSSEEVRHVLELRNQNLNLADLGDRDSVVRTRCMKRIASRLPFRPLIGFLYLYIWRRGFLDGYAGLMYCLLQLTHEINILVKLEEMRTNGLSQADTDRSGTPGL